MTTATPPLPPGPVSTRRDDNDEGKCNDEEGKGNSEDNNKGDDKEGDGHNEDNETIMMVTPPPPCPVLTQCPWPVPQPHINDDETRSSSSRAMMRIVYIVLLPS